MNLAETKIHPDKSLGQNFLVDKKILAEISQAAELRKNDVILEIGAGTGILTKELAARTKKVLAFEIDKKLIPILRERIKGFNNVEIINEDILVSLKLPEIIKSVKTYKVVANIPYNITSAVLEKFFSVVNKPLLLVLLVQKEVAERICSRPGQMSLLSVAAQYHGRPETIRIVPPAAFWPQPKVASAILKISVGAIHKLPTRPDFEKHFFQIVKAGFSHKRRMLKNNLKIWKQSKVADILISLSLSSLVRAEELSVEQWIKLAAGLDCA